MPDLLEKPDLIDRPQIDPRIARRWIEARRQEGRRRLRVLVATAAVVVVALLGLASLYSPIMEVRHVRATVDGPLTPAQVIGLTGLQHHPLMVSVDAKALEERIDSDPWLVAARVSRQWPSTVTLTVAVRSPLAVVALGAGNWAEVDVTGRVLADTTALLPGLPQIVGGGIGRAVPEPGGWLPGSLGSNVDPRRPLSSLVDMAAPSDGTDVPRGVTAALAVLAELPASVRAETETVTIGPGSSVGLSVSPLRSAIDTVRVHLGDGSQLNAKLGTLVTMLDQADLSGIAELDLSVPNRPAALTARS